VIYRLENTIQEYAWGDKHSISTLLGISNVAGKPQAELWMGAHPKCPSILMNGQEKIPLDKFISRSPLSSLGELTVKKFGKLPFLLKVLAAGEPLSIQAHPNLDQAKNGFERENQQKITLDAFNRSYKDDNHKPEIICALTIFHAMNGFRPIDQIVSNLELIQNNFLKKLVEVLRENTPTNGLKLFFELLMRCDESDKKAVLNSACAVAKNNHELAFEWVLKLNKQYPGDIGALCPLFLNVITLQPGEAMFLEAGRLHSYLQGVGIELMANSDNVLRGGLTPKFVDIDELLKVLKFEVSNLQILKPKGFLSEKFFPDFVDEFSLSGIDISDVVDYEMAQNKKPSILICTEGKGRFFDGKDFISFEKGQTFFIPADQLIVKISGKGHLYRATVAGV
jgi:mannose-6-phosphate isomerase